MVGDGTKSYIYSPNGTPLEQVTGSAPVYYHHDQQGTTRALTDTAGSVVSSYSVDPYGNVTNSTGLTTTPLRYNGQYGDVESGLVYMRARFYDSKVSQFLTRDPLNAATHATLMRT